MSITGLEQLETFAATLRGLGDVARGRGTQAAAEAVGAVARQQYASGKGPDGKAWPRNQDGTIPLAGPTSEIRFTASGGAIRATGPDVLKYHATKRPVFPENGTLPAPWAEAADRAMLAELERSARK